MLLPACEINANGSIKALTKPYITEYECVEGYLGGEDLLKQYDFIKITLLNKEELEVSFKPKNGKKRAFKGAYQVDPETREMTGEVGVFGVQFREKIKIENGQFVIVRKILTKPLLLKFQTK